MMACFEGEHTVFDIAGNNTELGYWDVMDYVEKFRANGLVDPRPI